MKFVIYCRDKVGQTALRTENRAAHLAYAKQINDRILCGGPLLSPDGAEMIGSLLVIEFDSLQAAQDWAKTTPTPRLAFSNRCRSRRGDRVYLLKTWVNKSENSLLRNFRRL